MSKLVHMASPEHSNGESRPSWEEYESSNITGAVFGKSDNPPSWELARRKREGETPYCTVSPDREKSPGMWSAQHMQAAKAAIPLLKEPSKDLLSSVEVLPKSSEHFEYWRIRIDLNELNEDGEPVPLEERIWITGNLKGSEPEIAPKKVLGLFADKLAERIAIETNAGNQQAQ